MGQTSTVEKIYAQYERMDRLEKSRKYLGASLIGHTCDRYLWLSFRWVRPEKFTGRMLRLFERGEREEKRFIQDLLSIGVKVYALDGHGRQFAVEALEGHFYGHLDGIGEGFEEYPDAKVVLEFKTHNERSFKKLQKEGVEISKPQHYAQMQIYMGHTNIKCAAYLAVNKNNDEMYLEFVGFSKAAFDTLMAKAQRIIYEETRPPESIGEKSHWECKFCAYKNFCHGDQLPKKSCRTCIHATPVENGQWKCELAKDIIPGEVTYQGCRSHLFIPDLIPAEVQDATDSFILYSKDGQVFRNIVEDVEQNNAECLSFTSDEIHKVDSLDFALSEAVRKTKMIMEAQVKGIID